MCNTANQLRTIADGMIEAAAELRRQADDLDWDTDGVIDPPERITA